jgi:hypothetical protein
MNYFRNHEQPRRELTVRDKLERIARTFRTPDEVTLEALMDDLSPQELRDRGRCAPVDKILEDAFQVYFTAFEVMRKTGEAQRSAVRGCTRDMLLLAIRQALALHTTSLAVAKDRAQRATAAGTAEQRLRERFGRAMTMREQARRLIASVVRDDPELRAEVARAAIALEADGSVAVAMTGLAAVGERALASTAVVMSQRARLLGLDADYVASLSALGRELTADEDELRKIASQDDGEEQLIVEAGRCVCLMLLVVEAFEAAHEVDAAVPQLKVVHTRKLMRRLSKIPPPPVPIPKGLPAAEARPWQAAGAEFHGAMGRGRR